MIQAPISAQPKPSGPFFVRPRTQTVHFRTPVCPVISLQMLTGKQLQSGIALAACTTACIPHIYK